LFVKQYDYDLTDETFQQYCAARGTLHVAGKAGSRRWDYYVEYSRTKDEYLNDPYFHFAEEWRGERYRFTHSELEIGWMIILLGRATGSVMSSVATSLELAHAAAR
jgi:hypothetical protein